MGVREKTIEKLIVKHEILARRIKYCDLTGRQNRKKVEKLRKKLYQEELWIEFLAGMAEISVDWKDEYYYTSNFLQVRISHPIQHYTF